MANDSGWQSFLVRVVGEYTPALDVDVTCPFCGRTSEEAGAIYAAPAERRDSDDADPLPWTAYKCQICLDRERRNTATGRED